MMSNLTLTQYFQLNLKITLSLIESIQKKSGFLQSCLLQISCMRERVKEQTGTKYAFLRKHNSGMTTVIWPVIYFYLKTTDKQSQQIYDVVG